MKKLILLIIIVFVGGYSQDEVQNAITLEKDYQVSIDLDLTGFPISDIDQIDVGILGGREPLDWSIDNVEHILKRVDNSNTWKIDLLFNKGTYRDFPFKFVFWNSDEKWTWERLPGYFNHAIYIPISDDAVYMANLKFNEESGYIESTDISRDYVDNYDLLLQKTGERGVQEGYQYYKVLAYVINGQFQNALDLFKKDKTYFNDPLYYDDFHWVMIHQMENQGHYLEARTVLKTMLENDLNQHRREFWEYVNAESYFNEGKNEEAKKYLKRLHDRGIVDDEVRESTILAYSMTYLHGEEIDSVRKGITLLKNNLQHIKDNKRNRLALIKIQNAYYQEQDFRNYAKYSKKLTIVGTERQKNIAWLNYFEGKLLNADYLELIAEADMRMNTVRNTPLEAGFNYYKGVALIESGREEEGRGVLEGLANSKNTEYSDKARNKMNQLNGKRGQNK